MWEDKAACSRLYLLKLLLRPLLVYHVPSKIGDLGLNGVKLSNHNGADEGFVVKGSPQFQHMCFSLSSFPAAELLVLLGDILVLVISVSFIIVLETKHADDLAGVVAVFVGSSQLSILNEPLLLPPLSDHIESVCLKIGIVVEEFQLGVESLFVY